MKQSQNQADFQGTSINVWWIFDIPLHLSHTVIEVHGRERLSGVTVCAVDQRMQPISGTEEYIPCDTLIVSVGLIPENELAETLGIAILPKTKAHYAIRTIRPPLPAYLAAATHYMLTIWSTMCQKAVKKAGAAASKQAARPFTSSNYVSVKGSSDFAYIVPSRLEAETNKKVQFFFRSKATRGTITVKLYLGNEEIFRKKSMAV